MDEEELLLNENGFIIDSMVWSFSRLNSFYNCPYEFYLHYIECNKSEGSFFAAFGSFVHKILEMYAKGELTIFDISIYYEDHFWEEVPYDAPPNKYVDIKQSYYEKGLEYLDNINLILDDYDVLGVEKKIEFKIGDYDAIGFIDLLLRDKNTGEVIILDHKSASLKFKKNGEISKTDAKHYLDFKRQLYLYSKPVFEEYGRVDYMRWNMFKDRKFITIPWKQEEYDEAQKWAEDTIAAIQKEIEWPPNPDFYYCNYLCGQRNNACEYKP